MEAQNPNAGLPEPAPAPSERRGWLIHSLLFAAYPVALGAVGSQSAARAGPLLPATVSGVLSTTVIELSVFGVVLLLGWRASRATVDDLFLRWNDGIRPVVHGLVYSVALRVAIGILLAMIVGLAAAFTGAGAGTAEKLRPQTEVLVDANALTGDPIYFALMLTLVSFVLAGFREELWRAAMVAGLTGLFPRHFSTRPRRLLAVALAALLFGLGHLPQGWGGVALTAALGFGLGAIMLIHNSLWESVFAHGFFNATSFALLYGAAKYFPGKIPGF